MEEINFVEHRRKKLNKQQKNDLKIFRIALGIFGVGVAIFLVLLGTNFYLQFRLRGIQDNQDILTQRVQSQIEVEESILVTIEKLKVLAELFDQRHDKQSAIEYFSGLFGSDVLIQDINYEADDRILSLRLQSDSVFSLENVFERLAQPEVSETFGQVNKSALSRNDQAMYSVVITLNLNDNG